MYKVQQGSLKQIRTVLFCPFDVGVANAIGRWGWAERQSIGVACREGNEMSHSVETNLGISFRDHPLCPALPVAQVSWNCFGCTEEALKGWK